MKRSISTVLAAALAVLSLAAPAAALVGPPPVDTCDVLTEVQAVQEQTTVTSPLVEKVDGVTALNDDTIVVPWGVWFQSAVDGAGELLVVALTGIIIWAIKNLAPKAAGLILMILSEQAIRRAVQGGIAKTKGAAEGKVLTIPVTNQLVEAVGDYLVSNVSPAVVKFIGDSWPSVRDKILARLVEIGVVPKDYGEADAKKAKAPHDFEKAIHAGLGGSIKSFFSL